MLEFPERFIANYMYLYTGPPGDKSVSWYQEESREELRGNTFGTGGDCCEIFDCGGLNREEQKKI